MWRKIKLWFTPEYKLIVQHMGKEKILHVKKFKSKNPKKISGVTLDNKEFELKSVEPMEWQLEELKDD
jgi:hypothetical protein